MTPLRTDFLRRRMRIATWTWGPADAPPLVLVHGGKDIARSWDRIGAAFPDRRVIAPDLRGHGESGWSEDAVYAVGDLVADLVFLLDQLGIARTDLVGHSLGGNVAWRLAALFPERVGRLCVIEGLGPAPGQTDPDSHQAPTARLRARLTEELGHDREARVYLDVASAAARLQNANPRLDEAFALHLARHGTREVEGGVVFRHDPAMTGFGAIDLTEAERRTLWADIAGPVLLLHGAESWASNPAEDGRAAAFPDARVISIAGAGHSLHHDRPDEVIAALRDFFDG